MGKLGLIAGRRGPCRSRSSAACRAAERPTLRGPAEGPSRPCAGAVRRRWTLAWPSLARSSRRSKTAGCAAVCFAGVVRSAGLRHAEAGHPGHGRDPWRDRRRRQGRRRPDALHAARVRARGLFRRGRRSSGRWPDHRRGAARSPCAGEADQARHRDRGRGGPGARPRSTSARRRSWPTAWCWRWRPRREPTPCWRRCAGRRRPARRARPAGRPGQGAQADPGPAGRSAHHRPRHGDARGCGRGWLASSARPAAS